MVNQGGSDDVQTPNHQWTPRWYALKAHAEQIRLWNDERRFKIIPAGRRSGKTELAKRRLIEHLFRKTFDGRPGRYFAAGPTRQQAKRIWWDDLKALLPARWRRDVSESDLRLRTRKGAELWVVGLDRPQRVEGVSWDGGVIDEYADCRPGTFDAHIRPALADRRGWLWLIGVPDMRGPAQSEYARLFEIAVSGSDPEWAAFHWPSADILPADEVESARRRMDPRLFEQEMLGRFVLAGGRACGDFDPAVHIRQVEYDPTLPLCWSLDFNIDPMCSGLIQHVRGEVRVLDEFALPDTRTELACTAMIERCAERGWSLDGLAIYGDATGNARDSTSGTSDWTIVRNRLRDVNKLRMKVPAGNPSVKDTLNAVNARLHSAAGEVRLYVHPRCTQLIRNLSDALWPGDLDAHHSLAWLRYFVHREYPVRLERSAGPQRIGLG